eukprot:PLAT11350.2.p1 GENE.PLAT11350.2~~PLAT11350.2.p1  ORF type:complete len:533 (+),score=160.56 PLAT11350.2:97-1599(+)
MEAGASVSPAAAASGEMTLWSARRALLAAFAASLAVFSFGFVVAFTGGLGIALRDDLKLNAVSQVPFISSAPAIGALFGSLSIGFVAERYGRRKALFLSSLPVAVGWLLLALSRDFLEAALARLLSGVGIGAASVVVPMYITEISPGALRGTLGNINQFSITVGVLVAFLLAFPVVNNPHWWRTVAWIGVGPPVLLMMIIPTLPETPYWLASCGELTEAEVSLKWLLDSGSAVRDEMHSITSTLGRSTSIGSASELDSSPSIRQLLRERAVLKPLELAIVLMLLQQFGGINAVILYAGAILQAAGLPPSSALVGIVIVAATQVVMNAPSAALVDRAGRRCLIITSLLVQALALAALGAYFWVDEHNEGAAKGYSWLAVASLVTYIAGFGVGMGPVPWLALAELAPQRSRALTSSTATAVNWLSVFVIGQSFHALRSLLSTGGTFWLYGAVCVAGIIYTALRLPETKGLTLEEVARLFEEEDGALIGVASASRPAEIEQLL